MCDLLDLNVAEPRINNLFLISNFVCAIHVRVRIFYIAVAPTLKRDILYVIFIRETDYFRLTENRSIYFYVKRNEPILRPILFLSIIL